MDKSKFLVALGTAHLGWTAGKRSPDGKFREPVYSREICQGIKETLQPMGYNVVIDWEPLDGKPQWKSSSQDIMQQRELAGRVAIVNELCKKWGKDNVLYLPIHNDAAAGTGWANAGGFTVYTTRGTTKADRLAECLYDAAERHLKGYVTYMETGKKKGLYGSIQKPFRIDKSDGDRDKEANYFVLKNTLCPAALTENLYQNNKADVEFLMSEAGKRAIINFHVEGIINYIQSL